MGFPRGAAAKNLPADAGDGGREDLPQEGTATTPVFSAGGSQGQRSLAGCGPQGCADATRHDPTKAAERTCTRDTSQRLLFFFF